jgi:hypothetical protein
MISSDVQRTLVKSPPELWAELSDPDALTRHLGALGEIRITRVEPESRVEWEAGEAGEIRGTVAIKASGWGTKVTLSATRELQAVEQPVEVERADGASAPVAEDPGGPAPSVCTAEHTEASVPALEAQEASRDPDAAPPDEPSEQDASVAEPPPPAAAEPAPLEPVKRRGLFARLFSRRRPDEAAQRAVEPELVAAAQEVEVAELPEDKPAGDEPTASSEPSSDGATSPTDAARDESTDAPELAAELRAAEEIEVTAVLTAALDRLGAAHHRPFSRA